MYIMSKINRKRFKSVYTLILSMFSVREKLIITLGETDRNKCIFIHLSFAHGIFCHVYTCLFQRAEKMAL